ERPLEESGRRPVAPQLVAQIGKSDRLVGVPGRVLAAQDLRQPRLERDQPLGGADPLRRGVRPAPLLPAQLMTAAQGGEGLREWSQALQGKSQAAMGLGVVGPERDDAAVRRLGPREVAPVAEEDRQVIMRLGLIGTQLDGAAILRLGAGMVASGAEGIA